MNIQINSNNTKFSVVVTAIINSLKKNVKYTPAINDHNQIENFRDYIFSRYIDKLSTVAVNYIKIEMIVNTINFKEIEDLEVDNLEAINDESKIELISLILRPLIEIYLEIKSIELCKDKLDLPIEDSCNLLYFDSLIQLINLKKSISKEVYNCEPKYLKIWSEWARKEFQKIKQQLSENDVILLKNTKNKYKGVLEGFDKTERRLLGYDYLTHYSMLSKKTHFSYTNIPFSFLKPNVYLTWSMLYILHIYNDIMKMINGTDVISEVVSKLIEEYKNNVQESNEHEFKNGDYIFIEYGVAKILKIDDLTFDIEYLTSNIFNTGDTDQIPRIFITGKVDEEFYNQTMTKFYPERKDIYNDEKFQPFYLEMYEHSKPNIVSIPS